MNSDRALALAICVLFGLFLLFGVSTIEAGGGLAFEKSYAVGPRFFPYLAGGAVFVCGLGLIVFPEREGIDTLSAAEWKNLAVAVIAVGALVLCLQLLGFVVAGVIGTAILVFRFSTLKWHLALLFSVALPVAIQLVFGFGFRLELPQGTVLAALF